MPIPDPVRRTPYYSPVWTERIIRQRVKNGTMRITSLGRELKCRRCGEFWPADTEFFFSQINQPLGIQGNCKSCYIENRYPNGRSS